MPCYPHIHVSYLLMVRSHKGRAVKRMWRKRRTSANAPHAQLCIVKLYVKLQSDGGAVVYRVTGIVTSARGRHWQNRD